MIEYVTGDATAPHDRPALIAHVCNDIGAWGAGFVLAVSKRWRTPEVGYRALFAGKHIDTLGMVHVVDCEPGIRVANMIAQRGVGSGVRIRYDALETCLRKLASHAAVSGETIAMPRIGCGLAGGSWDDVEPLILRACAVVKVVVYDYAPRP